ncbi:MAG: VPLPA-CTERM-specific exosortase XrtD [Methylicorpusculum sp.]|uniref:VPLPA-CTERM-specific exosortase XrtD n=1 Tax=Methylicorpusculum sp. TaxID=2713644 RepID=UPI0027210F6E|nr:VPLPA-CTERM-specific exosortase XrtD [Methylicorpusculum sp.]MDO8938929.1 VPLPA-CTERM-specific exosortase XrtD [Methylicorpusculum sp.]MDP2203968.1 VPLPA-CTERM-specific exosortase XrtD [Methylicorpusculum sp.]
MKLNYALLISAALIALLIGLIFGDALITMVGRWESEEYSHGYLIPVISFWFVWENRLALAKMQFEPQWTGVVCVLIGLLIGFAGNLATLSIISQYAFLLVLFGMCLAYTGWKGIRLLWFPLVYLIFMIPLPNFLYNNLSSELQLISSQIGVAVIRSFGISVFLAGNVIDLGNFQLQVVEACSGLRYLFPLASFCFLCAYFFRAKLWMRILIVLSTLPITVLMNSFRIGVIGVLVDNWGIEQAEGFLHDFEGWVIFIGCLGILFIEMWLLVKIFYKGKKFSQVFVIGAQPLDVLGIPEEAEQVQTVQSQTLFYGLPKPFLTALVLLIIAAPISMFVGDREEISPERSRFTTFPLTISDWKGVEVGMGQKYIDELKFDDYIIANYTKPGEVSPVNFYVAYYASQRQGASAHSPKSCIPGDGWRIGEFTQRSLPGATMSDGSPIRVNRAVISKGDSKQLVYYWFQQRGRNITNEYLVKWYLFWDALTRQRTDGALVRLVVALPESRSTEEGDKILEAFIKDVHGQLPAYIPN